jgi:hypothetical protein
MCGGCNRDSGDSKFMRSFPNHIRWYAGCKISCVCVRTIYPDFGFIIERKSRNQAIFWRGLHVLHYILNCNKRCLVFENLTARSAVDHLAAGCRRDYDVCTISKKPQPVYNGSCINCCGQISVTIEQFLSKLMPLDAERILHKHYISKNRLRRVLV